ncbi:zinc finger, c3HC4 type (RING finger) domain-containing protein [Ditylenchus destructor]|nr:zinc finger, c3HC4 type (RING finger) domain-containing protein [Ditylenchus destructor]
MSEPSSNTSTQNSTSHNSTHIQLLPVNSHRTQDECEADSYSYQCMRQDLRDRIHYLEDQYNGMFASLESMITSMNRMSLSNFNLSKKLTKTRYDLLASSLPGFVSAIDDTVQPDPNAGWSIAAVVKLGKRKRPSYDRLCLICSQTEINTLNVNCFHAVFCRGCAIKYIAHGKQNGGTKCPNCRISIAGICMMYL